MSRPMLLVFLLIVLIVTSQFEWKQPLVVEQDTTTPTAAEKQLRISERQESVKEMVILSQEKIIQDLKNIVGDLEEQLKLCRGRQETLNSTLRSSRDNNVFEIEQTVTMHD